MWHILRHIWVLSLAAIISTSHSAACTKLSPRKPSQYCWYPVSSPISSYMIAGTLSCPLSAATWLLEEDFTHLVPCLVPRQQLHDCWKRILHTWYPVSSPVSSYSIRRASSRIQVDPPPKIKILLAVDWSFTWVKLVVDKWSDLPCRQVDFSASCNLKPTHCQ